MPNILVAVCGGISAYKSCELVRTLQRRGANVRVIMTASAQKFVTKLTFESLTRSAVHSDLFDDEAFGTAHIEAARWADLLVIAPLTANTLAKLVQGQADDFLSTVYLAFRGSVIAAPAMNTAMWEHDAVRTNLVKLKSRGVHVIDPIPGELACGEVGVGKMADPETITNAIFEKISDKSGPLSGKRVLITAGPTREYIDPVRYLSNPSTGAMGLAVAREAMRRGADVTVIHGPIDFEKDERIRFVPVTSAKEMSAAVAKEERFDVFIGTAAVSDYRPAKPSHSKLKKSKAGESLELQRTDDILETVSKTKGPKDVVVGFAAETENVTQNARGKLVAKGLDLIVANPVYREKKGFGSGRTDVHFIGPDEPDQALEDVSKDDVAVALWNRVEKIVESRS
jgi:phosphopantothenoylcysteine decarboxylase / phosphopantothenate---cysteine ligase